MATQVITHRLSARRGRVEVLHDVSFELAGGVGVLLGPNGAGKTTLLGAIVGLLKPSSGSISVDDGARDFQRKLGFVPQDTGLPAGVSAREIVEYAAWLQRVPRAQRGVRADAALAAVRLIDRQGQSVNKLSGGLRRRVQLACAIVHSPGLLVLDEPTVGLDPAEQEAFRVLVRAQGEERTVLLSTHQLDEAATVADRIIVLSEGRVRLDEPAAELTGDGEEPDARVLRDAYLAAVGAVDVA